MDSSPTSLFDVYLRLRPSLAGGTDRFLDVEPPDYDCYPKHITIKPPSNDHRKRAVEKFAFTRVFEENASQLDTFRGAGVLPLLDGVLAADGKSRDGLLATLGVTGSGKSHTILGSRAQRGLTQMALDVLFQSIAGNIVHPTCANSVFPSIAASDVSEGQIMTASAFLDPVNDGMSARGSVSRAQTPMMDNTSFLSLPPTKQNKMPRTSMLPTLPNMEEFEARIDPAYEYVIVVSMYEVYNDRIFDLLSGQATNNKHGTPRRRALLFKSTELSPDRKVVAGLRKVICCSLEEALMVLETGLLERKVAGTGSNAVSSRSHGFFCVDVKRRHRVDKGRWKSSTLTVVDMAGSERARNAKTAGATLAEAGKINESLMYLGQCMQMQSDNHDGQKVCTLHSSALSSEANFFAL
jgi:kinesin motor protein